VKIKPMLVRLQSTIGRDDLIEQMVLLPEPRKTFSKKASTAKPINLIVAYDASPKSHTALDIAFWIAHQTRLATNTSVTVQAVYVVADKQKSQYSDIFSFTRHITPLECPVSNVSKSVTPVLTQPKLQAIAPNLQEKSLAVIQQADQILWQARSLAEEWQGSFKSHLRFGSVAAELKKVVELETADILFIGCRSVHHPIIQALGSDFPCAVLGIPSCIEE
jgi:nucleotide-binding universal stress UspA family protein